MLERADNHLQQVREVDLLGFDGDRARLDLREVENVGDQVEEVGAGAVNRARELDLFGREVLLRVIGELLAENQNAVQRRAQLVRHVGQELRLVLRGQRELFGLLFEGAPCLFDFLILAFDFGVLLGELLRLQRELLVGLLQFLLLRLQLVGELLRLLQQAFRLHRRFDRVEQDADARGELLEERQVRGRELTERGETDDRLDLPFEAHRQHDDISRQGLERHRSDRRGVPRDV